MWLPMELRRNLEAAAESLASMEKRIAADKESAAQEGMDRPRDVIVRDKKLLVMARSRLKRLQIEAMNILKQEHQ